MLHPLLLINFHKHMNIRMIKEIKKGENEVGKKPIWGQTPTRDI